MPEPSEHLGHGGLSQNLAGIHDTQWVQSRFNPMHQIHFDRTFVVRQGVTLQLSDPVFRTDRTANGMNAIMDQIIHIVLSGQQLIFGQARPSRHVVMQIAIAQVPENNVADTGESRLQSGIRAFDEFSDPRNGDGDIMFDAFANFFFSQWNAFAQMP